MPSALASDLLAALDRLAGGAHTGFRPVHARGGMYAGTFAPAAGAADLTRAPHASRPATPVTVRFSPAGRVAATADNDPRESSPQGMAVRFHLGEHAHTDIVAHSHNGFPVRTGEEFLAFLTAAADSVKPDAPTPPPIAAFLETHPAARRFVEAPKPIPSSYARQAFFAVTAFKFTNAAGAGRFGRFRLVPGAGTEYLTAEQAAARPTDFLAAELSERLATGPVRFRVVVQLAADGDPVDDATVVWPKDRPQAEFGTLTITERIDELAPDNRKVIFDPDPRVDGIGPAGDSLTQVRSDIYLMSGRRRRAAV
ncbi:MAG: catalase family peroxidase [Gemmataceae bacterium]|nr:catalase family peroxidase [Gemmataceae bacterium]